MRSDWNGDESLLKDTDIVRLNIDFKHKTLKVIALQDDGSYYELSMRRFTFASPFGLIAKGLRRMVSNQINKEAT